MIVAGMHRINFGKSVDPLAGMGRSSLYSKELMEKLGFFKSKILIKYNVGVVGKAWYLLLSLSWSICINFSVKGRVHSEACDQDVSSSCIHSKTTGRKW